MPVRGPFHRFFHHNSNSIKISFCSHPCCSEVIAMKFCTWHDSCAVMPCAKFSSDTMPYNGVKLKPIFHQMMEKLFVKWAPGTQEGRGANLDVSVLPNSGNILLSIIRIFPRGNESPSWTDKLHKTEMNISVMSDTKWWGLWYQMRVSQAGISNCIPQ